MLDGRKITTLVMLAVFTGAVLVALTLPSKAAFMPFLVGIPGILLCLAQLVVDFRGAEVAAKAPKGGGEDEGRTEFQMFLWLFLFTFALIGFGFLWGGPVIVAMFIRFCSRDSWSNALFAAAGTFAVLFGVFVWLLELRLFPGLILKALF
jgi:hypothetical protein